MKKVLIRLYYGSGATSEEINRSVEEINRIAGETAVGMSESSSAVHEITRMSQELKGLRDRLQS